MKIASKTEIGKVRETNQDSYAAGELSGSAAWVVVCDGMGGANGGNIASAMAVKTISQCITSTYREGMSSNSIRDMLLSAASAANISVYDTARSVDALEGMGTTVVVAIIANGMVHVSHAGDSRAYIIDGNEIEQITRDHSIVQTMIENGQITSDEARRHPRKNVITRALGVDENTEVEYNEVNFSEKDVLLICTDGLTNYVAEDEIKRVINTNNFYDYPKLLTELANENGGGDNVTVVAISA